jgi:bifunctional non-homologous end joining protein LigD
VSSREHRIHIDGQEVELTHPDKILFPDAGFTKRDLVDYYLRIAPWILPHLRGRPVAMERYPDGIDRPGFFHKSAPAYFPEWIETFTVEKKQGGTARHVVCNGPATLAYLANQGCVTPHVWLSRTDKLERPDQMVFDLDPGSVSTFDWVKAPAQSLKELLDQLDLPAYLKSTGSRGLHVVLPVKRRESFDSVRSLARKLAASVASQEPRQHTLEQHTNMRRGRVYLDVNRNAYAQTVAPPYAVHARRGAPVSTPLSWRELGSRQLRPDGATIRSIIKRLESRLDPWADFRQCVASLGRARHQMEDLSAT